MLSKIIAFLPYLGVAVATNILLGLYYNLEKIKEVFSWKKLLLGIVKAAIVCEAFIGLALIFDKIAGVVDVGIFEVAPDVLLYAAMAVYVGKCIVTLKNIFTVTDEQIKAVKDAMPEYEKEYDTGESTKADMTEVG